MTIARTLASWVIAAAALLACNEPQATAPVGAVRVHSALADAQLFIDAHERGLLRDGMEVELPPGAHVLEARRDGAIVATLTVEVRAAMLFEATLDGSSAVAAAPSEVAAREDPEPPVAPPTTPTAAAEPRRGHHVESGLERHSPMTAAVEPSAPAGPLLTPARAEILAAMNSIKPAVATCTEGDAHGTFVIRVAFSGDGRVREASAERSALDPAQERCVIEAVRGLRLTAFSQDRFVLTYPFRY